MSIDLRQLSIFPGTEEQVVESQRRSFKAWGRRGSLEEYIGRSAKELYLEHARGGRLITWVLAPRDDPGTLDFQSSCETYRREGLVYRRKSPEDGGTIEVQEVTCYGIASVFTEEARRGKGSASHMMRLLHWVLAREEFLPEFPRDAWGEPPTRPQNVGDGWFSMLWSDVGEDFYAACGVLPGTTDGWKSCPGETTTFDGIPEMHWEIQGDARWRWLDDEAMDDFWSCASQELKRPDELLVKEGLSVTFLPSEGLGSSHHRTNSSRIQREVPNEVWALVSADCVEGETSRLTADQAALAFTLDVTASPRSLNITYLSAHLEAIPAMLKALFEFCKVKGLGKVEIWGCTPGCLASIQRIGGTTKGRTEHISGLKWYGEHNAKGISLMNEQRYAWC